MKKILNHEDRVIKIPNELDTTFNLKINSVLKQEFEEVCKDNHTNMSREIKIFMEKAIKFGNFELRVKSPWED